MQLGRRNLSGETPNNLSTRHTQSGDSDFSLAIAPHLSIMQRAAAALVGVAEAEDATQEAVVRAWQSWHTLRDTGALRSWLLRITVNICQDWRRGRFGTHRARTQPLLADEVLPLGLLGDDPGASDATGALDLRHAINQLDADLRVIVVLRYYADMDATEIGAVLNMPPATVRTRLRRALARLRERLALPPNPEPPNPEKGGC